jgi:signal transduction histidine kinase
MTGTVVVLSADPPLPPLPYAGVVSSAVRSFLDEPRVPDPPARDWRDWALFAVVVVGAVVEAALRSDLVWRWASLGLCLAIAPTLLWRRSHPLAMTLIAFGTTSVVSVVAAVVAGEPIGLYTTAVVLVLPYALFRWDSGRHALMGIPVMLVAYVVGITTDPGTVGEAIGGLTVLSIPALVGTMIRYKTSARARAIEEIRSQEREQIARELHDTVAHHVSAISVQAQAGRTLAATRPDEALAVLGVIEEAASRTLTEMRDMVRALRGGSEAELSPQQGMADLLRLGQAGGNSLTVDVSLDDQLGPVGPAVDAAIYRIAQESVTNAVRHARHATKVEVQVAGIGDQLVVTVVDDGDLVTFDQADAGYGLLGMAERVKLLGGTLEAGPRPNGGWCIAATLPRNGRRA